MRLFHTNKKAVYSTHFYRHWCQARHLTSFSVTIKETDLWIKAQRLLITQAKEAVFKYRAQLEKYIYFHPIFKKSLFPLPFDPFAPKIVQRMLKAAQNTGVGPMAAVAGAIAQAVGEELLSYSEEVVVENGGDIFLKNKTPMHISIFAGQSPLSGRIGLKIKPCSHPISVCTSSGKIGHSFSYGKADAVTVVAKDAALADAAATAIGNLINKKEDIQTGIKLAQKINGIVGLLIILNEHLAIWGQIDLVKV